MAAVVRCCYTIAGLGGLHILVNNAGIARDALIFNVEPDDEGCDCRRCRDCLCTIG